MLKKLAIFALTQVAQVAAWNSETHLMTAKRAYDILQEKNPAALQKAEEVLSKFSDYSTQKHEADYPFIECVTWPDDIKRIGGGWQSSWHFDDQPIFGDSTPKDQLNVEVEVKNISTVMPQLYKWLRGKPDTSSLAYTTVMRHSKNEDEGKAQALRLLIHYYGDVHQPLHDANRYTKGRPHGDRGGNDFILKYHLSANELHAVWDTVIYANHKSIKRPFTNESMVAFGKLTDDFMDGIHVSYKTYRTLNFAKFRDESFEIAQHVYDGLEEGKDKLVPDQYIQKYQPIAKERVAIAAYRLAYMIQQLYGTSTDAEAETESESDLFMF